MLYVYIHTYICFSFSKSIYKRYLLQQFCCGTHTNKENYKQPGCTLNMRKSLRNYGICKLENYAVI